MRCHLWHAGITLRCAALRCAATLPSQANHLAADLPDQRIGALPLDEWRAVERRYRRSLFQGPVPFGNDAPICQLSTLFFGRTLNLHMQLPAKISIDATCMVNSPV
ncbi:hypothetical protein HBI56_107600 [Parastagonospora nodorum]|uniref:Uncharacterized protein n=2 Tax=Phaeosphaeria nodorum (strain SN15 / ATCC MYA-4574 / FGSC 10173) TaxID=321614 RepID=Q0U9D2_PHANO|nr:hypothetical protein SNOG_11632 [Parastagonospora nodorum SN15]KAH3911167.1 hypothetical protein HBH56_131280 [Parastagonospora nodorum]EAT81340.1 hypothetical protein SNOG_11632 [Parastagonospora nodorum SN15]KAH3937848.1 hypothetical protein HBH54_007410 [Parastagonospora nodorum]KAH3949321.1 hypothetical protein HBH53_086240 [Parastagonospora nodorum]KAH3974854.1 hypothetical protein HBH52_135330 [Parastagonospora nodorum]